MRQLRLPFVRQPKSQADALPQRAGRRKSARRRTQNEPQTTHATSSSRLFRLAYYPVMLPLRITQRKTHNFISSMTLYIFRLFRCIGIDSLGARAFFPGFSPDVFFFFSSPSSVERRRLVCRLHVNGSQFPRPPATVAAS